MYINRRVRHFFLYIIKASITTKLKDSKTHVKPTVKLAAKTDVIAFVAIRTKYIQRRSLVFLALKIATVRHTDRQRRFLKQNFQIRIFCIAISPHIGHVEKK